MSFLEITRITFSVSNGGSFRGSFEGSSIFLFTLVFYFGDIFGFYWIDEGYIRKLNWLFELVNGGAEKGECE